MTKEWADRLHAQRRQHADYVSNFDVALVALNMMVGHEAQANPDQEPSLREATEWLDDRYPGTAPREADAYDDLPLFAEEAP